MWTYNYTPNTELYHHGILGQKWGVKNGPPYPLKAGDHSSSEKKAGWKKSLQQKTKESSNSEKSGKQNTTESKGLGFVRKNSNKKVSDLAGGGEAVAVYLAALGITLGVAAAKKAKTVKSRMNELDSRLSQSNVKSMDDVPKLKKSMSASESMKVVNPDFPSKGTTMNCTFCTTALALREKGYDVKANKSDYGWPTKQMFSKIFKGSKEEKVGRSVNTSSKLLNKLSEQGDGAYGNLTVYWHLGGGHSVFYKNEGGKTRIYDGQNGEEYTASQEKYEQFCNSIRISSSLYSRLDNAEPTDYALSVIKPMNEKEKD